MTEIVEIRDYTIEQAWLEAYKEWAEQLAAPWLKKNLDVVDFWVDDGIEASVDGSDPKNPFPSPRLRYFEAFHAAENTFESEQPKKKSRKLKLKVLQLQAVRLAAEI